LVPDGATIDRLVTAVIAEQHDWADRNDRGHVYRSGNSR